MSPLKKALLKDLACWTALVIILFLVNNLAGSIALGIAAIIMGVELYLYRRRTNCVRSFGRSKLTPEE